MKLLIDISEDIFTRLFDVGTEGMNVEDRIEVGKAIRKGVPFYEIRGEKIGEEKEVIETCEFDPSKLIPCPKCGYKGASFFLDSDNDEGKPMCVIQCDNHEEYTVNGNPHYHHLCDADVEAETLSEAIELWNRGLAE